MIRRILRAIPKPVHYKDGYIEILRRVNAGMLHHGNILCFNYAIQHLPTNNPIVEIGTFCGLSANVMTYLKKVHNKTNALLTVDKWRLSDNSDTVGSSNISYREYGQYVRESLKRNLTTFSGHDLPYAFESTSDDFFSKWQLRLPCRDIFNREFKLGGPISFAYIDGGHSFLNALSDFENCDRNLVDGGFIFFDDSADFSDWEVTKVIKIAKGTGRYKVVLKNPNYLFQKIK